MAHINTLPCSDAPSHDYQQSERGNPHMTISRQLLPRIADSSLPQGERARLRCRLAQELEDVGNYEAAREAMGELWSGVSERPILDGLDEAMAAEVLLRA